MSQKDTRIVVALGDSAILRSKNLSSYSGQFENVRRSCRQVAQLIAEGYQPIFTHGNGPQVGNLLIQNEAAAKFVPSVPLDACGAETQGQIGYMIQRRSRTSSIVPDELTQLSLVVGPRDEA
jgi:carbamate kinase